MFRFLVRAGRYLVPRPIRNWLRSPARSTEWVGDAVSYRLGRRLRFDVLPGWSVVCHPAAYRTLRNQVGDPDQLCELAQFVFRCTPDMTLFDVGAHYGVFSLAAAHYGGPNATSVAVEPSGRATKVLAIQAELNGMTNQVRVVEAAAGATGGTMAMIEMGVFADGYMIADYSNRHPAFDYTEVRRVAIDSLCLEAQATPTHIKIDVEGLEADVVEGGWDTLQGAHPLVFVELHNDIVRSWGGDPGRTVWLLRESGYDRFSINGRPCTDDEMTGPGLVRVLAE